MLPGRDTARFRLAEALFWAVTWGAGAAIGVALGGWLTLVGGSGAPGAAGLDPTLDLGVLPGVAFGTVVLIHLTGQVVASVLRSGAKPRAESDGDG